jgi:hypothetical protein
LEFVKFQSLFFLAVRKCRNFSLFLPSRRLMPFRDELDRVTE